MSSFVVYIDESGDEGFKFPTEEGGKGSSEWFVIAAVITRKETDLETVSLVDRVHKRIQWQKNQQKKLHFSKLKPADRLTLLTEIAQADLRGITVLVHKPSLTNLQAFTQKNVLYHYAARYLLERVSMCCRAWRTEAQAGDGSAEVHFSNRGEWRFEDFQAYLSKLKSQTASIDWSIVRPEQCQILEPKKEKGQQIADALASALFFSVRRLHGGEPDPTYAKMLYPIIYHDAVGVYDGCGIKIWPKEYRRTLPRTSHWLWLREVYRFEE